MRTTHSAPAIVTFTLIGLVLPGCCPPRDQVDGNSVRAVSTPSGRREIVALGRLQPRGGIVSVSAIPGERLANLHCEEGDEVAGAGQSLGELASHTLREIEVAGLQAKINAAKMEIASELAVSNAQAQQAEVALAQARMQRDESAMKGDDVDLLGEQAAMARSDLEKLRLLAEEDAELTTEAELCKRELACKQVESKGRQAKRSFEMGLLFSELAVQSAEANLAAANAVVEQVKTTTSIEILRQQLNAAVLRQSWTTLPAPCAGTVLKTLIAPGEFVTQMPILQMADLTRMACIAEVYEADIQWIDEGDRVVLESQAFHGKTAKEGIPGRVASISRLIGPPGLRSLNPMARTDRHIVEVLIEIDPADVESTGEAARFVGMQVTVKFLQ